MGSIRLAQETKNKIVGELTRAVRAGNVMLLPQPERRGLIVRCPEGETTYGGWKWSNIELAQYIADSYNDGREVIMPSDTDEHGNRLWEIVDPNVQPSVLIRLKRGCYIDTARVVSVCATDNFVEVALAWDNGERVYESIETASAEAAVALADEIAMNVNRARFPVRAATVPDQPNQPPKHLADEMFAETPESTLSLHEVLGYGKYGSALTDPDEHVDHEHDIGGEGRITEPPAQQQQPMQRLRKYAAVATITDPTRKCTCPASDMLAEGWRCACGAAENGA